MDKKEENEYFDRIDEMFGCWSRGVKSPGEICRIKDLEKHTKSETFCKSVNWDYLFPKYIRDRLLKDDDCLNMDTVMEFLDWRKKRLGKR